MGDIIGTSGSRGLDSDLPERTYTPRDSFRWQLSHDYFMELQEHQKKLYWNEREIYELSKLIPQEELPKSITQLDMSRLRRVKFETY